MFKWKIIPLFMIMLLWLSNVHAASWMQQRWQFKEAYAALQKEDLKTFHTLSQNLQTYPIAHYLHYFYLLKQVKTEKPSVLNDFLTKHKDDAFVKPLRKKWLQHLAKIKDWQTFLDNYQPQKNIILRCQYLQAQLETEKIGDDFVKEALSLWTVGRSQPKTCDPAFNYLYKNELIDTHTRWIRIKNSMQKGNVRFAKYLAKSLPETEKAKASFWQTLHKNPEKALQNVTYADNDITRAMIAQGIKRLARKKAGQAHTFWQTYRKNYAFETETKNDVERYIALKALNQSHPNAMNWLDALAKDSVDEKVAHAKFIYILKQHNWALLAKMIKNLPDNVKEELKYQYWLGRALEQMEQFAQARIVFQKLAKERHYYGFLAADRLNEPYQFNHQALKIETAAQKALLAKPHFLEARELLKVGFSAQARLEWHRGLKNLTQQELRVAASLAHKWHWHDRAIATMHKAKTYDDLTIRFPTPYYDLAISQAEEKGIDVGWAYAVMRQESAFQLDARSTANALGLMQLLPATAKEEGRRQKLKIKTETDILDPENNIRLGIGYLQRQLKRFDNSYILATAAYNAGGSRSKRWKKAFGCVAPDIFVEMIPFTQTRDYVKRVLSYASIFEHRLLQQKEVTPMRVEPVDENCQPKDV